jgi:hypothetical protein
MAVLKKWTKPLAANDVGFFGSKIAIVCGECQGPTTAKLSEMVSVTDRGNRLAVYCQHCGYWNVTDYVPT